MGASAGVDASVDGTDSGGLLQSISGMFPYILLILLAVGNYLLYKYTLKPTEEAAFKTIFEEDRKEEMERMQRNHENARRQNAQLQPVVQGDLEAIKNMPEELLNLRIMVDPNAQEKGAQAEDDEDDEGEAAAEGEGDGEDEEGKGEGNPGKNKTKKAKKAKKKLFSATPLLVALGRGRIDSLQELLRRGQDPSEPGLGYGGPPAPPLCAVCTMSDQALPPQARRAAAVHLLNAGADVNAEPVTQGMTAAHICAFGDRRDLLALLVSRGADVSADCVQESGFTVLQLAICQKSINCAMLLLQLAVTSAVNAARAKGRQVPNEEEKKSALETIGADAVHAQNGHTALAFACLTGMFPVTRALVNLGCNPMQRWVLPFFFFSIYCCLLSFVFFVVLSNPIQSNPIHSILVCTHLTAI